jgi:adenosylhomocysteine nucleosidase
MNKKVELDKRTHFVVLISANAEWQVIRRSFSDCTVNNTPYGDWFLYNYQDQLGVRIPVIYLHGGWGKVAAAASSQYAINRWRPKLLINLGTCGGFEGEIYKGEIILAEKTIIYDIYEQMGDPEEHIRYFMTEIDTSWLQEPLPLQVRRTVLVSADRDLFIEDIAILKSKYGAIAGDWESGAIAWVAAKNRTQCLILRGVTDLIGSAGGEAYAGNVNFYYKNTELIMNRLTDSLLQWLLQFTEHYPVRNLKKKMTNNNS